MEVHLGKSGRVTFEKYLGQIEGRFERHLLEIGCFFYQSHSETFVSKDILWKSGAFLTRVIL